MIEQLRQASIKFLAADGKEEQVEKQEEVLALEMKKIEDHHYYISQKYNLGSVAYENELDLKWIMKETAERVADYLDFDQHRLLHHEHNRIMNIEKELETEDTNPLLDFYGFYELSAEKVFLLAVKGEVKEDITYGMIKNTMYSGQFPHEPCNGVQLTRNKELENSGTQQLKVN